MAHFVLVLNHDEIDMKIALRFAAPVHGTGVYNIKHVSVDWDFHTTGDPFKGADDERFTRSVHTDSRRTQLPRSRSK